MERKRRRVVVAAAAALLAVASMMLPQQAVAESKAGEPELVKKTFTITSPVGTLPAVNTGSSIAADPPLGPCYYDSISGHIDAYYRNGILEHTDNFFNASIECITTGPDQNMSRLTSIAKLYNFSDLRAEDVSQCVYPGTPCFQVFNWGFYQCWGQLECSGEWRAAYHKSLLLPRDWSWGPPTDPNCHVLGSENRELVCARQTNPVIVPPFG